MWWEGVLVIAAWVAVLVAPVLFTKGSGASQVTGDALAAEQAAVNKARAEFGADKERRGL